MRRRYPSDVSDARWRLLESVLAEPERPGRPRSTNTREVVNALNYRWTTGCPWRMLPHDFPAWATVYCYFQRWRDDGRLRQIREVLLRKSPYVPLAETDRKQWATDEPTRPSREKRGSDSATRSPLRAG